MTRLVSIWWLREKRASLACPSSVFNFMSESPRKSKPRKEALAPRQESLRTEFAAEDGSPERAYGEALLWAAARDPRTIFAYWQFDPAEHPEARGDDGASRFFLRIIHDDGFPDATVEIDPAAGHWFVPVSRPDCGYFAELGFFSRGVWCFLARSGNTRTPPEAVADADPAQFATIPARVTLDAMRRRLASSALPGEGIAQTAARVQASARQRQEWTDEEAHLLATLLGEERGLSPASGPSSADLARRLARRLAAAGEAAAQPGEIPGAWGGEGAGSPGASWAGSPGASWSRPAGQRAFFLHVNAEVIFYGGTDPAATLTVNGEAVNIRRDGSFRFHFRLPDGEFEVPIVAVSPDGKETRSATLRFQRATERVGDVGSTGQPDFLPGMIGGKP